MSCVTSSGYQAAAETLRDKRFSAMLIRQAVPILAATDAAANMLNIANKRDAIAQRQVTLAEEQLAQAELAWPCEEAQISESNTTPDPYTARYDQEVNKAGIAIRGAFGDKRIKLKRSFNRYSTGAKSTSLNKLCLAEQMAVNDAEMLAYQTERERVRIFEDRDWNRKLATAALGKNISSQVAGFYANAGGAGAAGFEASSRAFQNAIGQFEQNYARYTSASPFVQQDFVTSAQENLDSLQAVDSWEEFGGGVDPMADFPGADGTDSLPEVSATEESFGGGIGTQAGVSILADSTVKQIKVQGKDSRGDTINITVSESDITYTNAKDGEKPTTDITGY